MSSLFEGFFIWQTPVLPHLMSKGSYLRPCTMGVIRESAYENKSSILLSIGAYLYRRGA
jgi:hypothetical protein